MKPVLKMRQLEGFKSSVLFGESVSHSIIGFNVLNSPKKFEKRCFVEKMGPQFTGDSHISLQH